MFNKIYGEWLEARSARPAAERCAGTAFERCEPVREDGEEAAPVAGPGSGTSVLDAALLLFEQAQVLA